MQYFVYYLVILASTFFTRGLTNNPLLQGHLIFFVISAFFVFLYLLKTQKISPKSLVIIICGFIVFLHITFQYFVLELNIKIINELGRLVIPILTLAIYMITLENTSRPKILIRFFIIITIAFFSIDFILRMSQVNDLMSRYSVKRGGFLFTDSNFTGYFASSFILLFKEYKVLFSKAARKLIILSFIIILASTGSLAAYFMLGVGLVLRACIKSKKLYVLFSALISIIVLFFADLMSVLISDGSFNTKIKIITDAILLIKNVSFVELMLGQGSGLFAQVTAGKYPSHNLLGIFVEMGMLFLMVQFVIYYKLLKNSPVACYNLFFSSLLVSMISLYPISYIAIQWILIYSVAFLVCNDRSSLPIIKSKGL